MKDWLNNYLYWLPLLLWLGFCTLPTPARAQSLDPTPQYLAAATGTLTVNSIADPGIGGCDASECTLREAIAAANPGDTIRFALAKNAVISLTLTGIGSTLSLTKDLTIDGSSVAGLTVHGNDRTTPFRIETESHLLFHPVVRIKGLTITGGNAGAGGNGGALLNLGTLTLEDCILLGNRTRERGAILGQGGAIWNQGALTLLKTTVSGNRSNIGGGIYNIGVLTVTNSTVSGNLAYRESTNTSELNGGGGGIYAALGTTYIDFSTIAYNTAQGRGGGLLNTNFNGSSQVELHSSLIANNTSTNTTGNNCANFSFSTTVPNQILSLGYNLASDDSCPLIATGDKPNLNPLLGPLSNNGGATPTHALLSGSPAIHAGDPACPPPANDQRGTARPQGARCDIGAFEQSDFSTSLSRLILGSTSAGSIGGVNFADEDLLLFDQANHTWRKYFDGSDVGLAANDLDALVLAGRDLLLSLELSATLPNLGFVEPNDILRFRPASLGESTSGSFEMFLDASDVGLERAGEDIDAATFLPDGRLAVSTRASYSITISTGTSLGGADEDWIVLNDAQFGPDTSGTWSLYFDGSDVDLTQPEEDIRGAGVTPSGELLLVTNGLFSVPGVSGDGSDVFACAPGSLGRTTTCSYRLFFAGAAHGFGDENIDSFELFDAPSSVIGSLTSADVDDKSVDDLNADDHSDLPEDTSSEEEKEMTQQSFLPLANR